MTALHDSRRTFLAVAAGAITSPAIVGGASAQSGMTMNDPSVVREIEAAFAGYDRALGANDVAALNGYFHDSPATVRYGIAENLYGFAEISAYRAGVAPPSGPPKRERTVITTFGNDFATVATLSRARAGEDHPDDAELGALSVRLADRRRTCEHDRQSGRVTPASIAGMRAR